MDFTIVDTLCTGRSPSVAISVGRFEVYMTNADLVAFLAFKSASDVDRQCRLDVPRSSVLMHGQPLPCLECIPSAVRQFCTQATLALPLTLLHQGGECAVTDSLGTSMQIDIWDDSVFVSKALQVWPHGSCERELQLTVSIDLVSQMTSIAFACL